MTDVHRLALPNFFATKTSMCSKKSDKSAWLDDAWLQSKIKGTLLYTGQDHVVCHMPQLFVLYMSRSTYWNLDEISIKSYSFFYKGMTKRVWYFWCFYLFFLLFFYDGLGEGVMETGKNCDNMLSFAWRDIIFLFQHAFINWLINKIEEP